jgi:AcrR family transcriptional regulator
MVVEPMRDRRAERREATRTEILDAAWELVRAEGLAALSLRELAARVGMRAPSLYSYFDSKHAIYDALFADGNRELLRRIESTSWDPDPRQAVRQGARLFVEFSTEDPARYLLLFQRTIPGFEPTAESYAVAEQVVAFSQARFGAVGISGPRAFDLWTALVAGLSAQQIANDPGGDRWLRLVDEAVDMFLEHINAKGKGRK